MCMCVESIVLKVPAHYVSYEMYHAKNGLVRHSSQCLLVIS